MLKVDPVIVGLRGGKLRTLGGWSALLFRVSSCPNVSNGELLSSAQIVYVCRFIYAKDAVTRRPARLNNKCAVPQCIAQQNGAALAR
jgi:hypothetical protein